MLQGYAPRGMLSQEFIPSDVVSGGQEEGLYLMMLLLLLKSTNHEYLVLNVVGEFTVVIPGHPPPPPPTSPFYEILNSNYQLIHTHLVVLQAEACRVSSTIYY